MKGVSPEHRAMRSPGLPMRFEGDPVGPSASWSLRAVGRALDDGLIFFALLSLYLIGVMAAAVSTLALASLAYFWTERHEPRRLAAFSAIDVVAVGVVCGSSRGLLARHRLASTPPAPARRKPIDPLFDRELDGGP